MAGAMLKVSGLSVSEGGMLILDNISFELEQRQILAVVGPNGAGKTTLFRAIMNLIPYSGKVQWASGVRIGYVPQSLVSTDLPISVGEFLALKGIKDSRNALESVGLGLHISEHRLSKLSGGQLQRVLLAWAVSDNPDVLLFDEPTSLVDIGSEEPIYEMLKRMREEMGVTVLIISHNMHIVSHYTDMTLSLNRRQIFFGNTRSVHHDRLMALMSGIENV